MRLPDPPALVPPVRWVGQEEASLRLMCEFKRRSPSAGELSSKLSIEQRVRCYEDNGADLISVLCDSAFFGGAYEDLSRARSATSLPLLCKEFIIDEVQLDAARAHGASLVLLIVRCLGETDLQRLIKAAGERGLEPLVEVFNEQEARIAQHAGARFIGVNARDLDTLKMDSERANRVVSGFGPGICVAHLSGVKSPQDVARVRDSRADAALIGEVLMRKDDPGPTLAQFAASAASSAAAT